MHMNGRAIFGVIALAAALVAVGLPSTARADLLGDLVNRFMESVLYAEPHRAPSAPRDLREIPDTAHPGIMSPPRGVITAINGRRIRMSAAIRIWDRNNRIILPNSVRRPIPVRFQLNHLGHLHRVWIASANDPAFAVRYVDPGLPDN